MSNEIINKVSESMLTSIDLEHFYPTKEIIAFDLKDFLFMNLIVKEKEFRQLFKEADLSLYSNKLVAIYCSVDAIIPMWAYMVAVRYLQPIAFEVILGNKDEVIEEKWIENIKQINADDYIDKKIVIKGCGDKKASPKLYTTITQLLLPKVYSIFYGEPCSTVPVYKKPKPIL